MSVITRAAEQVKSLVLPGTGGTGIARYSFSGDRGIVGERSYSALIGDGSGSALFVACIGIIAAAFAEAPVIVRTVPTDNSVPEIMPTHPMYRILRAPLWDPTIRRSFFGPSVLTSALLCSWWLDGNAYVVRVRAKGSRVPVQRWYVPHWMMEPRWPDDGSKFISHYEYAPDGREPTKIAVADVEHYRFGIDSTNIRKGWSPLKSVLREIYVDEEAARFSAAILHNVGVPGLMLSPAKDSKRALSPDEAKLVKADVEQKTTGDRRGETLVFTNPTELKMFGFSPADLNLSAIRDVTEERVSSVMRVPAMVAGFGAGLDGVKVGATAAQLWAQLWQINILPTQRTFAEELQGQLLPDFATDADLERQQVGYDLRDVAALADQEMAKVGRWKELTDAQLAKRKEARAAIGLPWTDPEDDVYLGRGLTPTSTGDGGPTPPDVPAPPPDPALLALTDQVGKMRDEIAQAKHDRRPDPDVLRLIETMDRAAASRDATVLKGVLELAASLRPQPHEDPPQLVKIRDDVKRDEKGRILAIVPVHGRLEKNGNGKEPAGG